MRDNQFAQPTCQICEDRHKPGDLTACRDSLREQRDRARETIKAHSAMLDRFANIADDLQGGFPGAQAKLFNLLERYRDQDEQDGGKYG